MKRKLHRKLDMMKRRKPKRKLRKRKDEGCSFCGADKKYVSLSQGTYTCSKCGTKWSVM